MQASVESTIHKKKEYFTQVTLCTQDQSDDTHAAKGTLAFDCVKHHKLQVEALHH
jgi:hypothetical protein